MEEKLLLQKFRSLIRAEITDINDATLNDELLMCFLRAKKKNLSRALILFKNYLRNALSNPNLMTPPTKADLKKVLNCGYYSISPVRDQKSECPVVLINFVGWDNKLHGPELGLQTMLNCIQYLVSEEGSQLRGVILIIDARSISLRQIKQLGLLLPIKFAALSNNTFPIRVKDVHIMNESMIIRYFVNTIWRFLSAKIRQRVHFHGNSSESLHRYVDPNCLPFEYGGVLDSIKTMNFLEFIESTPNVFGSLNKQLLWQAV